MNITISPFTIDLYDRVMALWQQTDGVGLSGADARENIQFYLERNPGLSFIAECDGELAGTVLCGHDGRRGYIYHLAVHPAYRRQGLGRTLVDHCLSALQQFGIQQSHLFILNTNLDGAHFWESIGWTRRTDISVMSKDIEAVPPGGCCL